MMVFEDILCFSLQDTVIEFCVVLYSRTYVLLKVLLILNHRADE